MFYSIFEVILLFYAITTIDKTYLNLSFITFRFHKQKREFRRLKGPTISVSDLHYSFTNNRLEFMDIDITEDVHEAVDLVADTPMRDNISDCRSNLYLDNEQQYCENNAAEKHNGRPTSTTSKYGNRLTVNSDIMVDNRNKYYKNNVDKEKHSNLLNASANNDSTQSNSHTENVIFEIDDNSIPMHPSINAQSRSISGILRPQSTSDEVSDYRTDMGSGEASDTFYSVTGPSRSRSRSNVRVTVIEYPDYGPEQ